MLPDLRRTCCCFWWRIEQSSAPPWSKDQPVGYPAGTTSSLRCFSGQRAPDAGCFLNPGAMRTRFALEKAASVPTLAWAASPGCWSEGVDGFAHIEPRSADSRFRSRRAGDPVTRITLRMRDGIVGGMRFTTMDASFGSSPCTIEDETGRYLVCRVREGRAMNLSFAP